MTYFQQLTQDQVPDGVYKKVLCMVLGQVKDQVMTELVTQIVDRVSDQVWWKIDHILRDQINKGSQ
jgi:hypothetical protein